MIQSARKAEWVHIGKLMAIYLVGSALALGASWSKISATIDYTKDTMRGTPILTTKGDGGEAKKGKDWNTIMLWPGATTALTSWLLLYPMQQVEAQVNG